MDDEAHGRYALARDGAEPAPVQIGDEPTPQQREPEASRHARSGADDETVAAHSPVPGEPALGLDPREVARAALAAGRNASLWWVSAGIVVVTVVALVVGTRAGVWSLAALLAVCAAVRALRPPPGPTALSVRFKALDVVVLLALAVTLALLGAILPSGTHIG